MLIKVANKDEIISGTGKVVEVNNKAIALFNVDGQIFAIDNTCVHRGGSLGEGMLDEKTVSCPLHYWQYNVETGKCLNVPTAKVNSYRVVVDNNNIMVEI
ncbi:MAG: nitrite reductase small subunit NirD [Nanoarchaeota archaeon]